MTPAVLCGRTLGEFVVAEHLDDGGNGAVYRCAQPMLGREAVIKVLHERPRAGALERFFREARLASRLDHPYAAHVYAFGVEEDGLAWIAMEYVHGRTLRTALDELGPMPLEQFVPFFDCVCEVVEAAHEQGIVHRDVKPGNIMVTSRLHPKLLDFGIAKMRSDDEEEPAIDESQPLPVGELTPTDCVLGSPPYVAPEIWRGLRATPASDVYSLAVIAFEALTGRRPFRGESIAELRDQHLREPIPPVGGTLPVGLDAVFQRALSKDPDQRYASPTELSAALRCVLDTQLVAQIRTAARAWDGRGRSAELLWSGSALADVELWARRTSLGGLSSVEVAFVDASRDAAAAAEERVERSRSRARRLGVGLAAALVVGIMGTVQGYTRYEARLSQQHAEDAREMARQTKITAEFEQGRSSLLSGDTREARRHLGIAWDMGEHSRATQFMLDRSMDPVRAELAKLQGHGRMWSASWSPDGRWIVTTDDQGAQLWDGEGYERRAWLPHGDAVYAAAWMSGGRVATACGDGAVRVWDVAGRLVRELRVKGQEPRWYVLAVSGERVAAVDAKGRVAAVWGAGDGGVLTDVALDGGEWPSVAFSADGRRLAMSGGNTAEMSDTLNWRSRSLPIRDVHALAWDPVGERLVVGTGSGGLVMWSASTMQHLRVESDPVDAVAFSPDGLLVADARRGGIEQVFSASSGRLVSSSNHVHGRVMSIGFSEDGRLLSAGASTGIVAISEAISGRRISLFDSPRAAAESIGFDRRSGRIIGATWDGIAWVWGAASPYLRWSAPALAETCGLIGGAQPDGRYLAVACVGHQTRVWDVAEDRLLAELPALEDSDRVPYPIVSASGDRAAIARGRVAEVYELPGGRLVRRIEHGSRVTALAFTAGGELVSGDAAGAVMSDDRGLMDLEAAVDALAVWPSGRLAVADARGRVHVDGREIDAEIRARMLRLSPDGRRLLAVPSYAGPVAPPVLIDMTRGTVTRLDGPQVYAARWTSVGILTAHADGSARMWDGQGAHLRTLFADRIFLVDASLTEDGSMVVGVSGDGALHFWSASDGVHLWKLPTQSSTMLGVSVARWGITARGGDGGMSRWSVPEQTVGKIANALPFQ